MKSYVILWVINDWLCKGIISKYQSKKDQEWTFRQEIIK